LENSNLVGSDLGQLVQLIVQLEQKVLALHKELNSSTKQIIARIDDRSQVIEQLFKSQLVALGGG